MNSRKEKKYRNKLNVKTYRKFNEKKREKEDALITAALEVYVDWEMRMLEKMMKENPMEVSEERKKRMLDNIMEEFKRRKLKEGEQL